MDEHETPQDRATALAMIRMAMVEKKITQALLAEEAACHEKTVQNLLAGRTVRDQTLFDVCAVLGLEFQTIKDAWSGTTISGPMELRGDGGMAAPVYMGAYTQAAVDHYIGSFLTVRPAFSKPDTIIAYRTKITWDPDWPSLVFEEFDRPDSKYQHRGRVYVPTSSPFIHLVSLTKGAMRMVMLSQIDEMGHLRGIITTLNRQGAMLLPVSAPIVYKYSDAENDAFGTITPDHKAYQAYAEMIGEAVDEGYARLISKPNMQPSST
ncbi:MAG: helix-turn-helix transcriptional regulator [Pseudomonadota bacterium]